MMGTVVLATSPAMAIAVLATPPEKADPAILVPGIDLATVVAQGVDPVVVGVAAAPSAPT